MGSFGKILSFFAIFFSLLIAFIFVISFASLIMLLNKSMNEKDLASTHSDRAVAVVALEGEIFDAKEFLKDLREQVEDESIKAIVVKIDSPGGAVGASEEIYQAIKRLREKKPITCSMGTIAASGGLYSALGCEKIVAHEGTITGSIGVIFMMPNFTSVIQQIGVGVTVVKSGKFKDAGSPIRNPTQEELNLLQGVVDLAYEQFVRKISEARGIPVEQIREFADGRIILGETALKLGLIDEVGDVVTAARLALASLQIEGEPEMIYPEEASGFMRLLEEVESSSTISWISALWRKPFLYYGSLPIQG